MFPFLPLLLSAFFVECRIRFLWRFVLFRKRLRQASAGRGHSPETYEVGELDAEHVAQHVGRGRDDVELGADELRPRYFPPVDRNLLAGAFNFSKWLSKRIIIQTIVYNTIYNFQISTSWIGIWEKTSPTHYKFLYPGCIIDGALVERKRFWL